MSDTPRTNAALLGPTRELEKTCRTLERKLDTAELQLSMWEAGEIVREETLKDWKALEEARVIIDGFCRVLGEENPVSAMVELKRWERCLLDKNRNHDTVGG